MGKTDPLDRWSLRLGEQFAWQYDGRAIYPFTGPPYQPFLSWAQANGDSFQSPLGLHIHHQHGLWHEYRFGLILDLNEPTKSKLITNPLTNDDSTKGHFSQSKPIDHPCKRCIQPCMQACPVGAFSFNNYDVAACRIYVQKNPNFLRSKWVCGPFSLPKSPIGFYFAEQHQYHMAIFACQI
ncbi:MAG: hypothetical protein ACKVJ2_08555 [Pseudomonadales bacterium]